MKRFSAQYIYAYRQLLRYHVLEIKNKEEYVLFPLTKEIPFTEFYNGVIVVLHTDKDTGNIRKQFEELMADGKKLLSVLQDLSQDREKKEFNVYLLDNVDLQQLQWLPESTIKQIF